MKGGIRWTHNESLPLGAIIECSNLGQLSRNHFRFLPPCRPGSTLQISVLSTYKFSVYQISSKKYKRPLSTSCQSGVLLLWSEGSSSFVDSWQNETVASGLELTLPRTWRSTWDLATHPGRDVPRSFPLFISLNSHNSPVKLDLRTFDNGRNGLTENDLSKITWQVNGRVRNWTYFCPNPKPVFFPTIKDFPNDSLIFVWHFTVYKALLFYMYFPASWKSPYKIF